MHVNNASELSCVYHRLVNAVLCVIAFPICQAQNTNTHVCADEALLLVCSYLTTYYIYKSYS